MKSIKFFIVALITFLATGLYAQKNTLSISVGPSFPMGDFAKADAGEFGNWNNTAGFAKVGPAFIVNGNFHLLAGLSLGASLAYADHGGFSKSDVSLLGASYTDAFGVDESTVSTSGRYSALSILAGPVYTFPLGGKMSLDLGAKAGLLKSLSTPEMTVELEDQSNFTQASSTASVFAWQASGGLDYSLSDHLGALLEVGYLGAGKLKIDNENRNNSAGRMVTDQPMSWLNTSIGITYKF